MRVTSADGDGRKGYVDLTTVLFSNYNTIIPPTADGTRNAVNADVIVFLEFVSLDTKLQTLTTFTWFKVTWVDPALAWNRSQYEIDKLYVSFNAIWRPELVIYNSLKPRDQLMVTQLDLQILSNGSVEWGPGDSLTTTCSVDTRLFPFDTQTCDIEFGPWVQYDTTSATCSRVVTENLQSAEWHVVNTSCKRVEEDEDGKLIWFFQSRITMRRKWLVYVVSMLLPIALVSALNCVVFVLPFQCGEKMGVSLTTFLTLAVFMTMIQDSLPNNSDNQCYLSVYLGAQMLIGALAIMVSAGTVALQHKHSVISGFDPTSTHVGTVARGHQLIQRVDKICLILFIFLNVLCFVVFYFYVFL